MFVAEPVEEPLQCWLREAGVTASTSFAPYNKVFQQLLDPLILQARNYNGVNIALGRLDNWRGTRVPAPRAEVLLRHLREELNHSVIDFLAGVAKLRTPHASPLVVNLCPSTLSISDSIQKATILREIEEMLATEAWRMSAVEVVISDTVLSFYPIVDYNNPNGRTSTAISYRSPLYTALSMIIARFDAELTPTLLFTSQVTMAERADALVQQQVRKISSENIDQILYGLSELTDEQADSLASSGSSDDHLPVCK